MEGILPEGAPINRPPGFNGSHYSFWKGKFKVYVMASDFGLWNVIQDGDYVPTKKENDILVPKKLIEFNEDDQKKYVLNSKAILMIQSALSQDEYYRISNLPSAKDMWNALETAYEGTAGVKENRINTLTTEYELLKMLPEETIGKFQLRFIRLINQLSSLGREYDQRTQVRKILNVLTKEWESKVTAIEEARGESMQSVAALFGSLTEYEGKLKHKKDINEISTKNKSLALKSVKADKIEEEEEEADDDEDDYELGLMVRKFRRFYRKDQGFRKSQKGGSSNESKKQIICYNCDKPGHFKSECPDLKDKEKEKKRFNKYKKKAYVSGIWGESSSDEEDNPKEHKANLCLVAREENSEKDEVNDSEATFDELLSEYNSLLSDFRTMAKELLISKRKNKTLEDQIQTISSPISIIEKPRDPPYEELLSEYNIIQSEWERMAENLSTLRKEKDFLETQVGISSKTIVCEDCNDLEKKNLALTKTLEKFTKGSEMLNVILTQQRFTNDKSGIGYKPELDKRKGRKKVGEKLYLNRFQKSTFSSNPFAYCSYCNRKGHSTSACFHKKERKVNLAGNYKWVPKGTYTAPSIRTNHKGPKKKWVPKA